MDLQLLPRTCCYMERCIRSYGLQRLKHVIQAGHGFGSCALCDDRAGCCVLSRMRVWLLFRTANVRLNAPMKLTTCLSDVGLSFVL